MSVDEQQQETAPAHDQAGSTIGDQVMDILQDVERQFDRLRQVQSSQAQEVSTLAERSAELDQRGHELGRQAEAIEARQHQLDERARELERRHEQVERGAETLSREEAELSELRAVLSQERRELDGRRSELAAERDALEVEQAAFEEARQRWKERRKTSDAEFATQLAELEQREEELGRDQERRITAMGERLAWLEKALERTEAEHHEASQRADVERQRAHRAEVDIEAMTASIQETTRLLEVGAARQRELEERVAALDAELTTVRDQNERTETDAIELVQEAEQQRDEARGELEEARRREDALREQLDETRRALKSALQRSDDGAERAQQLEQECTESAGQLETLRAERDELRAELDDVRRSSAAVTERLEAEREAAVRLETELAGVREDLEGCRSELADREERVENLERRLDDSRTKLELAGEKLSKFSGILAQQSEQLEQAAAVAVVADQQRQQIESLTRQLAEAKLSGDPEAVQRKDQRIKELTEALRQARGQTGAMIDVDELERRNDELAGQNDELRLELERTQVAAREAQGQLDEHLSHAAASQQSREKSLREEIMQLKAQLAETGAELDVARRAAEEQSQATEEAVLAAEEQRQATEEAVLAAEEQRQVLEERLEELEGRLQEGAAVQPSAAAAPLVDEARLLEHVEHLRRRHARLKRIRRLLRRARTGAVTTDVTQEQRAAELRKLQQERVQLDEVRRMLAATERKMIQRWAMPRAFTVVCWLLILVTLNGGAAWLASDLLHPVESAGTVIVEAVSDANQPAKAAELQSWRTWCTDLLEDERFHAALAKRMADQRMDMYADAGAISTRLEGLGVDTAEPGQLMLSLTGTNEEEVLAVLDVVAGTLAARSKQEAAKRSGGVYGSVVGERVDDGRVRYAALSPVAVHDVRLQQALPIFGVLIVVSLTVVLTCYRRLARAKRLFEEVDDAFLVEAA
ncbi:MAG: coiled-coil domain-containing protein [Planctomycetota bacterium]|jgi:chromosome segregation ATPase